MSDADPCLVEQPITDDATSDTQRRNEPVFKRTGAPVWVVIGYYLRACDGFVEVTAQEGVWVDARRGPGGISSLLPEHPELDVCREEATNLSPIE
jgi:hypothetical protein